MSRSFRKSIQRILHAPSSKQVHVWAGLYGFFFTAIVPRFPSRHLREFHADAESRYSGSAASRGARAWKTCRSSDSRRPTVANRLAYIETTLHKAQQHNLVGLLLAEFVANSSRYSLRNWRRQSYPSELNIYKSIDYSSGMYIALYSIRTGCRGISHVSPAKKHSRRHG